IPAISALKRSCPDSYLASLLPIADSAAKLWTKRDLETTNYISKFENGSGVEGQCLKQRPLRAFMLQGQVTNGSPVVTGLSSTSNLIAGMPVSDQKRNITAGAVINSVDSPSQVTLSANATATDSALNIAFGISVWLDSKGFSGWGQGAFASATLMQHYHPS